MEIVIHVLTVLLFLLVAMYIISTLRPPPKGRPKRRLTLTTDREPADVAREVAHFSRISKYRLVKYDRDSGLVILGRAPSLTSWGYYFPVRIFRNDEGKTVCEVGITDKLFSLGSAAQRALERCFKGIEATISYP